MSPRQPHDARADLRRWLAVQPENFYLADHQLARLLMRLGPLEAARVSQLEDFGAVVAGPLDRAATINNLGGNLPRLDRWSGVGDRTEAIAHHPSYHDCGKAIYEDGHVIAAYAAPTHQNLHAQAAFYLSSHVGEAGHNCPVACTAGAVKALRAAGSPELKERFLPGLLTPRYEDRLDGAQFLTELQGGSDVGANAVVALADGEALGTTRWRIHGEKWFCSNADADVMLMTARFDPQQRGTRGLGLFLVPRLLEDGGVNHFSIRRLKDKIGTRSMPSGEIDFNGAVAYAVGAVSDGFLTVMTEVIATSRLYNSTGCAGIMRRACLIAQSYGSSRRAFGAPIGRFPQVQDMLASMRATSAAVTAGCLELAAGLDVIEAGRSSATERAFHRVAVNLVKLRSCQHSHRVVLTGIETLGGNGAIESFSVLPRLLRDNVVYENWEGTHNVLVAQTVRDFAKSHLAAPFFEQLSAALDAHGGGPLGRALAPARQAVQRARAATPAIVAEASEDAGVAALMLRPHCEALADAWFAAALANDVASELDDNRRVLETELLSFFCDAHLGELPPARDRKYAERVSRLAALDA